MAQSKYNTRVRLLTYLTLLLRFNTIFVINIQMIFLFQKFMRRIEYSIWTGRRQVTY